MSENTPRFGSIFVITMKVIGLILLGIAIAFMSFALEARLTVLAQA
jgi:hypothetical protein